jgi:hypothetical protein
MERTVFLCFLLLNEVYKVVIAIESFRLYNMEDILNSDMSREDSSQLRAKC